MIGLEKHNKNLVIATKDTNHSFQAMDNRKTASVPQWRPNREDGLTIFPPHHLVHNEWTHSE